VPGDRGAGGDQQAVEGRGTRREHASAHRRRQGQVPVTLKGRHQNGHQRFEPLAADPVRGFPQHDDRFAYRFVVQREPWTPTRSARDRSRFEQPNHVFPVVAGDRNEFIENLNFIVLRSGSISLPNRLQQILAGCIADFGCHMSSFRLPHWQQTS
jgi:hypothetical protein